MRARNSAKMHALVGRLAISVALGAVITVLVAWRCHRFAWMKEFYTEIENPKWPISVPSTWPQAPDGAMRTEDGPVAMECYLKWWPEGYGGSQYYVNVYESGWPCRAMIRYLVYDGGPERPRITEISVLHSGVPSPFDLQWTNTPNANYLPILPLWPGFALNTLFYGMLAYAAMAGFTVLKRRRRFKRGLCIQCAYPHTCGGICPECGMAVRSATKSSATAAEPAASTPV